MLLNIWTTFAPKFVNVNVQKLPNQVTLVLGLIFLKTKMKPKLVKKEGRNIQSDDAFKLDWTALKDVGSFLSS